MPQEYWPNGRAKLLDTEDNFIVGVEEGRFPARILRRFFEVGEGYGTKL